MMTNPTAKKLAWHVNWANTRISKYLDDLTEEDMCRQPSSIAPPIGWHIWHHTRFADLFQANFPRRKQVWEIQHLVEVYRLDPSRLGPLQLGTGISVEDAMYICSMINKQRLTNYTSRVATASNDVMNNLTVDALGEMQVGWFRIDFSTTPYSETDQASKMLLIDDIGWYMGHANRHLGMIEALISVMFDRDGTATL